MKQSKLQGETLWYRMVAGGTAPRYVRLRRRPSLSAILDGRDEKIEEGLEPHIATWRQHAEKRVRRSDQGNDCQPLAGAGTSP